MPRPRGCGASPGQPDAAYTDTLSLDLTTVVPSLAGPKRPQDRVAMSGMVKAFDEALELQGRAGSKNVRVARAGRGLRSRTW